MSGRSRLEIAARSAASPESCARLSRCSGNAKYGSSCSCCSIAASPMDVSWPRLSMRFDPAIPKPRATLVRPRSAQKRGNRPASGGESPANEALRASRADPLLTCDSTQTTRKRYLQRFSSPLTDSNRRPPPYHEREEGVDSCGVALGLAGLGVSLVTARCRALRGRATLVRPGSRASSWR